MSGSITLRNLASLDEPAIRALGDVLIDCVEAGASVSFMWPMTRAKADCFWRSVADGLARGERRLIVAEDAHGIVGTVQVILNLPENQPHRGDARAFSRRRRGVGAALLAAAEQQAREAGRTLLVLDTATGGDAERLYARQGWQRCGEIPHYALWPGGEPCATTVFFKFL